MNGCRLLLVWFVPATCASSRVHNLDPTNWRDMVPGNKFLVYFTVRGCKHCKRLAPMMEHVAESAPDLPVGKVDATAHNGMARTFGITRFPTIMRFDEERTFYEYLGPRTPPRLIAFARGDRSLGTAGHVMPEELLDNVPSWWLMFEALWPPFKTALAWAVGIAVAIKALAAGCLQLLKRREERQTSDEVYGKKEK